MRYLIALIFIIRFTETFSQNPIYVDFGKNESIESTTFVSDSDFLAAGSIDERTFISRFNENFDTIWTRYLNCSIADICYSDSSQIGVVGAGSKGLIICKLNITGQLIWEKYIDTTLRSIGYSIIPCNNGFIVTGQARPNDPDSIDVLIARVDNFGNIIWRKFHDYGSFDWGYALKKTNDGNFIVTGVAEEGNCYLLIKFNSLGDTIFNRRLKV